MNYDNDSPKMLTFDFGNGTEYTTDFSIDGFTNEDLEQIRILSNESGYISVKGLPFDSGLKQISPTFPEVTHMTEIKKIRFQCSLFAKICESCNQKIYDLKHNHRYDEEQQVKMNAYWLLRKMSTYAHKTLEKKLRTMIN